ncbi:MAG TPA: class I SAM-dependent methyltransferase [Gemmatimonadaceae bacterium]|nr:class I SAM-dependent methyltransferase [Gemmatimonadaceae bacterium]
MSTGLSRVASKYEKRYSSYFKDVPEVSFSIRDRNGAEHRFGTKDPAFTFAARDDRALSALDTLDSLVIAEAYLSGSLDVEGDLESTLSMRDFFADKHPLVTAWHMLGPKLRGQVKSDAEHISHHYDIDPDFFLAFLDQRHRCYSHGVFHCDDESLEDGITRKLDFALDSIEACPGDRVLDVGGGWGAFTEYAGKKDIQVTSLTISQVSEKFLNDIIGSEKLPCRVRLEHLHEHKPDKRYDAIVILGVTEHLPDYERSLALYRSMLKPGGKVYLDASAMRKKYDISSFLRRHIYPGNGSPMCLHDYLKAVAASPFQLDVVHDDRHNYALTSKHWAERFEAARAEIERRWGMAQYRKFRLYLWGCYDGFKRDYMQAYRVVLSLPSAATA